jgi:integrase
LTDQAIAILEPDPNRLPSAPAAYATVGGRANAAAAAWVFRDYRSRKAVNTLRNHDAALEHFARFLNERGMTANLDGAALVRDAAALRGVTWGIVEAWKVTLLNAGYSIGAVNNRLSAVRAYVRLAGKTGVISAEELTLILAVAGYGVTEGNRVDERRPKSRVGAKKAVAVGLTPEQARKLKRSTDDTGQAARDAMMMCLFLDHGLRLGELAGLTIESLDLSAGLMTFYRPKVDKVQTHSLTADTLIAARYYLELRPEGFRSNLWVASDRRGRLLPKSMSARAISKRVGLLGLMVGAPGLSPHDCRHYWATTAVKAGTGVFSLMDAGGWSSVAMPSRYVEAAAIANEGIVLQQ